MLKKPEFMITSLDTGDNPVQFKMARNSELKLPEKQGSKLVFSVPEIKNVTRPVAVEKYKNRTIRARDGDYIEINPDGFKPDSHRS